MRVLHVHNLMHRHYGKRNSYSGRKFSNGIIRANHNLYEFSDRDVVRYEAPLSIRPLGIQAMNRKLLETCDNYRPDLVLLGHSDLVSGKTLSEIRKILPNVKISQWFLDALWIDRNVKRLKSKMNHLDSIFVTTAGDVLNQFCTGKNKVCFVPNPCDQSLENYDNAKSSSLDIDLLFCGVGSESDDRYSLLQRLGQDIGSKLVFKSYGIYGKPPIWGSGYEDLLSRVKMALNLNREEGWKYYSSDRISQLMGNGILTFLWDKGDVRHLIGSENAVFFNSEEELRQKILYFHDNDSERIKIAANGRNFYHQHFSAEKIIEFILDITFERAHSFDYVWAQEVYS